MKDMRAVRFNERRKAMAAQANTLGSALLSAGFIKVLHDGTVLSVVLIWFVGAAALYGLGYGLLGLLEDDQ